MDQSRKFIRKATTNIKPRLDAMQRQAEMDQNRKFIRKATTNIKPRLDAMQRQTDLINPISHT